jgi:hypothetical protein
MHQSADSGEQALHAAQIAALNSLLSEAGREVVGPAADAVFALPKERVQPVQGAKANVGPDCRCHAPATLWCRLRAQQAASGGAGVRVATVSEYGLRREVNYATVAELANALVQALPPSVASCAADFRVREPDGSLLITTQLHMRRQRASGLLPCVLCGGFFGGERGLRDHRQVRHRQHYEAATEAVRDSRTALVPHRGLDDGLAEVWARRAAATQRARDSLPPALQAARDGDLAWLVELSASGWTPSGSGSRDRHGATALMWAAGGGHLAVVTHLVRVLGVGCLASPLVTTL